MFECARARPRADHGPLGPTHVPSCRSRSWAYRPDHMVCHASSVLLMIMFFVARSKSDRSKRTRRRTRGAPKGQKGERHGWRSRGSRAVKRAPDPRGPETRTPPGPETLVRGPGGTRGIRTACDLGSRSAISPGAQRRGGVGRIGSRSPSSTDEHPAHARSGSGQSCLGSELRPTSNPPGSGLRACGQARPRGPRSRSRTRLLERVVPTPQGSPPDPDPKMRSLSGSATLGRARDHYFV